MVFISKFLHFFSKKTVFLFWIDKQCCLFGKKKDIKKKIEIEYVRFDSVMKICRVFVC